MWQYISTYILPNASLKKINLNDFDFTQACFRNGREKSFQLSHFSVKVYIDSKTPKNIRIKHIIRY